jgi:hypothetical protein
MRFLWDFVGFHKIIRLQAARVQGSLEVYDRELKDYEFVELGGFDIFKFEVPEA